MKWEFRQSSLSAGEFHAFDPQPGEVWTVTIEREAIVLGSRQKASMVDDRLCALGRVEVATRRSGGGIVHLVPGEHLWIDITISRSHPQWTDDVVQSTMWLGDLWVRILGELGVESSIYRARLHADALGELICFASLGPGEVVDARGAKLVGISQRRTRESARFQCTLLSAWQPERLASLLVAPLTAGDLAELHERVGVVDLAVAEIEAAVHRALTTS